MTRLRASARLFLTAWVSFALFASTNVVREHYPAFALVRDGTFRVDEYQGLHPDIFVHKDGHSYIGNNVATAVFAAVPLFLANPALDALEAHEKGRLAAGTAPAGNYRVDMPLRQKFFQEVSARGLSLRFGAATLVTTVFLVAPLSALCVLAMFRLLIRGGISIGRARWLALVFGFGTPLFFRSAHLSPNIFVMYFTFASFGLLWPGWGGTVGTWRTAAAGLCAGLALACDYSGVVSLTCLFGYAVLSRAATDGLGRALRAAGPFVLGAVPAVGFLLYSQWAMYGDPFRPGQYWMPAVNYTDEGWRGFAAPSVETFLLNLLHPSYGLVAFGPLLVLGLWPARDGSILSRPERTFVVAFVALLMLFCAANQYSKMQWNTGFRYLLPLVPFLFLAACDRLASWPRWVVAAATVPAVLHTVVLCMARDCNPIVDTWRLAPDFGTWVAGVATETVPASYLRLGREGLQLPWLRVLQQTSPIDHPLLSRTWLPMAVLAAGAMFVALIWMVGRTSRPDGRRSASPPKAPPTVAVVVPMLNEAHVVEKSIRTLRTFLHEKFPYPAHIVIADNGSTDGTGDVARKLMAEFNDVDLISLSVRGRGRALRTAWTQSQADIVAYMDVDLSTGLEALEPMCRGIHEYGYDLATGSRLMRGSVITRCLKREILSRGYNLLIKAVLWTRFSDAQCGFKAVSRRAVDELLPLIENQHWFFDTELLVLGEKLGYRVLDVPVRWIEDPDSRVKIASTVWEDIKGVWRLRRLLWSGKLDGHRKGHWTDEPTAVAIGQATG